MSVFACKGATSSRENVRSWDRAALSDRVAFEEEGRLLGGKATTDGLSENLTISHTPKPIIATPIKTIQACVGIEARRPSTIAARINPPDKLGFPLPLRFLAISNPLSTQCRPIASIKDFVLTANSQNIRMLPVQRSTYPLPLGTTTSQRSHLFKSLYCSSLSSVNRTMTAATSH